MDFRVACASDFHFPIADSKAVDWFLSEAERFEANVIVLNGDLIEGKAASRHAKDERHAWDIKTEFETAKKLFDEINDRFPNAHKVWLYGNHDDNLINYNTGRLPKEVQELIRSYKTTYFADALRYWHEIDHYKHKSQWSVGQLTFRHGTECSQAGIKQNLFDYCAPNGLLIEGHTHRPEPVTQLKINQVRTDRWYCNTGCMMDVEQAHYMDRMRTSNWGQACLLATTSSPGITEGVQYLRKPHWKAELKIRQIGSQHYHDVSLTA